MLAYRNKREADMAKVKVNHSEYQRSHGKRARGRGYWAFSAFPDARIEDMFFPPHGTVSECAKAAAKHFGVSEVWAQP
jgi:hypothetical protein